MQCGRLITEAGDPLVTEAGDAFLVTECFSALRPGKVYKKQYPYWAPPQKKPYWESEYDFDDEEELLMLAATELD